MVLGTPPQPNFHYTPFLCQLNNRGTCIEKQRDLEEAKSSEIESSPPDERDSIHKRTHKGFPRRIHGLSDLHRKEPPSPQPVLFLFALFLSKSRFLLNRSLRSSFEIQFGKFFIS